MLNAAYTWSQAKGTSPGNFYEFATWQATAANAYELGVFGDHPLVPEGQPDKEFLDSLFQGAGGQGVGDEGWYGSLPYSVDHVVKVLGTYMAPSGFNVSEGMEEGLFPHSRSPLSGEELGEERRASHAGTARGKERLLSGHRNILDLPRGPGREDDTGPPVRGPGDRKRYRFAARFCPGPGAECL